MNHSTNPTALKPIIIIIIINIIIIIINIIVIIIDVIYYIVGFFFFGKVLSL